VKPRQRRKTEPSEDGISQTSGRCFQSADGRRLSLWTGESATGHDGLDDCAVTEIETVGSPHEFGIDTTSPRTFGFSDLSIISPIDNLSFDFPSEVDDNPTEEQQRQKIHPRTSNALVVPAQNRAVYPDLAMIAPVPVTSPRLEFVGPVFAEFSDRQNRRVLVDHFCSVLSHLIVFREEFGNPFQQLVLPLCKKSPAVMNAMYALASAHLEYRGVQNVEKSVYFHSQAINGLASLIDNGKKVQRNELLAAIMLLIYYEVVSNSRQHAKVGWGGRQSCF
jgi:hypothetical protein